MSILLNSLYTKYGIFTLPHGKIGDYLGDVYEDFINEIFKDIATVQSWPNHSLERYIVDQLFGYLQLNYNDIVAISSSRKGIPLTANGGTPKTDVHLKIILKDHTTIVVPLNVKQSTKDRVTFAEYDVATIINAISITDPKVIQLLEKHQYDASAKNFTKAEKDYLRTNLAPHVRSLVRWCITLWPYPTSQDIRYPEYVIRFDLHHPKDNPSLAHQFKAVTLYNIDEYIDKIMLDLKGKPRTGGFGTGLTWTYAKGSKGYKIQFKA